MPIDPNPNVHALIAGRESRRIIDANRPVDETSVQSLLDAARWAPSCSNRQPWRMIVCQNESLLQIRPTLSKGNAWALKAPLIVAFATRPELDCQITGRDYHTLGLGMAIENMLLQGTHLGLVVHPIAGFNEADLKDILGVPDPYRIYALVVAGHPGEWATADERTQKKESEERSRLPREETVSFGHWHFR